MQTQDFSKPDQDCVINELGGIVKTMVDADPRAGEDWASMNLMTEAGLDSVGILQFILEVEKKYGIAIANYELDAEVLRRLGNFAKLVVSKINETD